MRQILNIVVPLVVILAVWGFFTETVSHTYRDKTIIRWATDGNPARRQQIEAFEALHPDIHVVWDYGGDIMQKVMVQISGGKGPELFDIYSTDVFHQFASSNALKDLTPLIEADNKRVAQENAETHTTNLYTRQQLPSSPPVWASAEVPVELPVLSGDDLDEFGQYNLRITNLKTWCQQHAPDFVSRVEYLEYPMTPDLFWSGKLDMIAYQGEDEKQPHIRAVPTNVSGNAITYNRDIFDRYGVPYPSDSWTTEEFLETLRQVTRRVSPESSVYETFGIVPIWEESFVYAAGGRYFTEDKKSCIINEQGGRQGLTFVGSLFQEQGPDKLRYSPTLSDSLAGASQIEDWGQNFKAGLVAMVSAGRWVLSITGPTFNYGYAPIPHFPDTPRPRLVKMAARTTAISRDVTGEKLEAAFKFLRFLAGREYAQILHKSGDGFSGTRWYTQTETREPWATFDPEFPEVQSRMCARIRRRAGHQFWMWFKKHASPTLAEYTLEELVTMEPELLLERWQHSETPWHKLTANEQANYLNQTLRANGMTRAEQVVQMPAIAEYDQLWQLLPPDEQQRQTQQVLQSRLVPDPLAGLDDNRLAQLIREEWLSLSDSQRADIETEVRRELDVLVAAMGESMSEPFSPYISPSRYNIEVRNLKQRVQNNRLAPEQWAPELERILNNHLEQTLMPGKRDETYFYGNMIGITIIVILVLLGFFFGWVQRQEFLVRALEWAGIQRETVPHTYRTRETIAPLCFLAPNLIGFLMFTSIPVISSFCAAFTELNTLTESWVFVGFNNFTDLVLEPRFWYYLLNTVVLMLSIPLTMAASLMLAMLLHNKLKGVVFFRTIFYLPSVVNGVAIFLLWKWIYNNDYGLINMVLQNWFAISNPPQWLTGLCVIGPDYAPYFEFFWSKPALIIMTVWLAAGGPNMLLYLAGLSSIPPELYESASIDGASPWQRFWFITWPLLTPTTFFIFIVAIIGGLQGGFEQAYIMTGGGPEESTTTLGYYIYNTAFFEFRMGAASAAAWLLFVVILVFTVFSWRFGNKGDYYSV